VVGRSFRCAGVGVFDTGGGGHGGGEELDFDLGEGVLVGVYVEEVDSGWDVVEGEGCGGGAGVGRVGPVVEGDEGCV